MAFTQSVTDTSYGNLTGTHAWSSVHVHSCPWRWHLVHILSMIRSPLFVIYHGDSLPHTTDPTLGTYSFLEILYEHREHVEKPPLSMYLRDTIIASSYVYSTFRNRHNTFSPGIWHEILQSSPKTSLATVMIG